MSEPQLNSQQSSAKSEQESSHKPTDVISNDDATVDKLPIIADIMSKDVVTITPHQKVKDTIKILHERNVTGVAVVNDQNKVFGLISSLDVIIAAAMGKFDLKLEQLPIKLSVKKDIIKIKPTAPIKDALILIVKHKVGRLLVLDDNDELVGIVTRKDLLGYFSNEQAFGK